MTTLIHIKKKSKFYPLNYFVLFGLV